MPETLPALRPPKPEFPPGFWEQNGLWLSLTGLAALGALFLLWRVVSRKTASTTPPPATTARAALQALDPAPDDATLLTAVSGILRSYFIAALALPQTQLTNRELCQALNSHPKVEPGLSDAATRWLSAMEARRFGDSESGAASRPVDARTQQAVVEKALALIAQTEQALTPASAGTTTQG